MLGWAVARWLGIELAEPLHVTPRSIALGVAAAVPLLLGLMWTLSTRAAPVRALVQLVQNQLGPMLEGASVFQLTLLALLAGLAEEIVFRGVLQVWLGQALPALVAVLLASALFGAVHALTPAYALLAGLAGAYLGTIFFLLNNLVVPILAHAVYDLVALIVLVRRYRATQRLRGVN